MVQQQQQQQLESSKGSCRLRLRMRCQETKSTLFSVVAEAYVLDAGVRCLSNIRSSYDVGDMQIEPLSMS
jgi:hypothetical protein